VPRGDDSPAAAAPGELNAALKKLKIEFGVQTEHTFSAHFAELWSAIAEQSCAMDRELPDPALLVKAKDLQELRFQSSKLHAPSATQRCRCNDEPCVSFGETLTTRMRAAIAVLPFESPKLAVTAVVSEQDFATVLDRRLKRIEEMKLIEAKPTIDGVEGKAADVRLPPVVPDRRFRRI